MFDRLTGQPGPPPTGPTLLGRYLLPHSKTRYRLGEHHLEPGCYLAGAERSWLLTNEDEQTTWRGDFGGHPLPDSVLVDSIMGISTWLDDLSQLNGTLTDWLAASPLISGGETQLAGHKLDDKIRINLPYLRDVANNPYARLRAEHQRAPVSRTRHITWRTITHLSAHSETWAARTLSGVVPASLLAPIEQTDLDIYENRVVATLLRHLHKHVLIRETELATAVDFMAQCAKYLKEAEQHRSSWEQERRLYEEVNKLLQGNTIDDRLRKLRKEIGTLRQALAPLLSATLCRGVRGAYTGSIRLSPTNLLISDARYRHCAELWNNWVELRHNDGSAIDRHAAVARWCQAVGAYTMLLVVRALDQLGADTSDLARPAPDRPERRYQHRLGTVGLSWHTDAIVLSRNGKQVLRIVPLPHALTSTGDPHSVEQWVSDITATRATKPETRLAVTYPAHPAERAALPLDLRLAVHNVIGTAAEPDRPLPTLVPIGSTDLNSLERVARMIRYALDADAMLAYPYRISGPPEALSLTEQFPWLTTDERKLVVLSPPPSGDLSHLAKAVMRLRTSTSTYRQHGDNTDQLDALHNDLKAAVNEITRLTRCPIPTCGHEPARPDLTFTPRADSNTFRCACESCSAIWETRECVSCDERYPVLTTRNRRTETGGHGDYVDQRFGQDLLTEPCWTTAGTYICPTCGTCGERRRTRCERCQG